MAVRDSTATVNTGDRFVFFGNVQQIISLCGKLKKSGGKEGRRARFSFSLHILQHMPTKVSIK